MLSLTLRILSGLGIGTTPTTLIKHKVDTTIVELDPIVYEYARKYFALPANHRSFIGNALDFVETARKDTGTKQQYRYIVHDVFTGGAEPIALFTAEFLSGLYDLLKPDGAIAIVSLDADPTYRPC